MAANPFGNVSSGAGFSSDPNLGAGQANSFGAFGPDVELARINQYNDEITNPLGLRGYDLGTQNTYAPEQLTWLNGQLMAGENEISQWDLVNGKPIGSYDTLDDILGQTSYDSILSQYRDAESGSLPFDVSQLANPTYKARMQRWYPQIAKLPSEMIDYTKIANPYAEDFDTFKWFASDPENRSLLYGAYGGVQGGDSDWGWGGLSFNDDSGLRSGWSYEDIAGQDAWLGGGKGGRGGMTIQRANDLMKTLPELYPHVAIEDLDRAAYDALQKWSAGHGWDTYHYGMNSNDIIRAIGAELDGLPQGIAEQLTATDAKQLQAGRQRVSAAHAADDADDFGLGDLLSFAGPILSFIPGMQPFAIALNAANAIANKSPLGLLGAGLGLANLNGLTPDMMAGIDDVGQLGYASDVANPAMWDYVPDLDFTSLRGLGQLADSPLGKLTGKLGAAGVKQVMKQAQLDKMMQQLEGDVDVSDLDYEYTPTQMATPRWAGRRNAI